MKSPESFSNRKEDKGNKAKGRHRVASVIGGVCVFAGALTGCAGSLSEEDCRNIHAGSTPSKGSECYDELGVGTEEGVKSLDGPSVSPTDLPNPNPNPNSNPSTEVAIRTPGVNETTETELDSVSAEAGEKAISIAQYYLESIDNSSKKTYLDGEGRKASYGSGDENENGQFVGGAGDVAWVAGTSMGGNANHIKNEVGLRTNPSKLVEEGVDKLSVAYVKTHRMSEDGTRIERTVIFDASGKVIRVTQGESSIDEDGSPTPEDKKPQEFDPATERGQKMISQILTDASTGI